MVIPLYMLVNYAYSYLIKDLCYLKGQNDNQSKNKVNEVFQNIKMVKSFSSEDKEYLMFEKLQD
jgi:hypothetical protein